MATAIIDSKFRLLPRTPLRNAIDAAYLTDEEACVQLLLDNRWFSSVDERVIRERTERLVNQVRARGQSRGGIEAFMQEYDLSSDEGVVLMCLAEALLRIPDDKTVDLLIREKLTTAHWEEHLGRSQSLFVNASTWGLMLTGRIIKPPESFDAAQGLVQSMVRKSGESLIRNAIRNGMRIIAHQFVLGRTIDEAVSRCGRLYSPDYSYSFDMLGEAAVTREDADTFCEAYMDAVRRLRQLKSQGKKDSFTADSLSVKLSALHPRFEFRQQMKLESELYPRFFELARAAQQAGIGLTIDAEEADTLNITLDLFEAIHRDEGLKHWDGLGLVVQAYQKRALAVIEWLRELAISNRKRIPIRLVKGAYWDSEIKRAQEAGWQDYPVFTRKSNTDLCYLVCAQHIFAAADCFYPQFATHNAQTLSSIIQLGMGQGRYEFQRLHGMGDNLYHCLKEDEGCLALCRIYAPVGSHEDLLPYLVRRLLENGANSSFVNRIEDESITLESIEMNPRDRVINTSNHRHPAIPLPPKLYGDARRNSTGLNLDDRKELIALYEEIEAYLEKSYTAMPLVDGQAMHGRWAPVTNPADITDQAGEVVPADRKTVAHALEVGQRSAADWAGTLPQARAEVLETTANLMERQRSELVTLAVREAGKTLPDALSEVREAVDFCRYYAQLLRNEFGMEMTFAGTTGETNRMTLHGRGLFVCISPWNFPIAIFSGQIAAALAAGNGVVAKPASQTPLVGLRIVRLFHQAGVPADCLQYIPGSGAALGGMLVGDARVAGVSFTGSTETARTINQTMAARPGPIIPFIAETGGLNAMIVDSSALAEQAVSDILVSAFNSAGQRCSALRILLVQDEIAPGIIRMLSGAMRELMIGDPSRLATDVGPVIDAAARQTLQTHVERLGKTAELLASAKLTGECAKGVFFAPRLIEIKTLSSLQSEVFGPILHLIRYSSNSLARIISEIKATGYGLTLGIHSRVEANIRWVQRQLPVGNTYVNRNMIGAVVGVQPFGGEGLSGTGPKAGGPHTLLRYATERSVTVNNTAVGGNVNLLTLDE
ncbi:MAG: bifunctional proline dehydrogenase/L-glutamate gamma-semialdehyde dehydrogenase PutA [Pseudomonadota bacterium]